MVTMIYFLISIQYIPSTGEAFYWYSGAVGYTLAYSVMLLCLVFSLKYIFTGKTGFDNGFAYCVFLWGRELSDGCFASVAFYPAFVSVFAIKEEYVLFADSFGCVRDNCSG